jgi:Fe2+ transport system protein B
MKYLILIFLLIVNGFAITEIEKKQYSEQSNKNKKQYEQKLKYEDNKKAKFKELDSQIVEYKTKEKEKIKRNLNQKQISEKVNQKQYQKYQQEQNKRKTNQELLQRPKDSSVNIVVKKDEPVIKINKIINSKDIKKFIKTNKLKIASNFANKKIVSEFLKGKYTITLYIKDDIIYNIKGNPIIPFVLYGSYKNTKENIYKFIIPLEAKDKNDLYIHLADKKGKSLKLIHIDTKKAIQGEFYRFDIDE